METVTKDTKQDGGGKRSNKQSVDGCACGTCSVCCGVCDRAARCVMLVALTCGCCQLLEGATLIFVSAFLKMGLSHTERSIHLFFQLPCAAGTKMIARYKLLPSSRTRPETFEAFSRIA